MDRRRRKVDALHLKWRVGSIPSDGAINLWSDFTYTPAPEGLGRSIFGLGDVERIVRINEQVVVVVVVNGGVRVVGGAVAGNGDGEEAIRGRRRTTRVGHAVAHILPPV